MQWNEQTKLVFDLFVVIFVIRRKLGVVGSSPTYLTLPPYGILFFAPNSLTAKDYNE